MGVIAASQLSAEFPTLRVTPNSSTPVTPTPAQATTATGGTGTTAAPAANIAPTPPTDLRVMLKPLDPAAFFQGDLMSPLSMEGGTGGVLFPYTPSINFSQAVNYMDVQLTHTNTGYPAYTSTPSVSIGVTAKFTVQSQREGRYALACLHFFRTASKSYFGKDDAANSRAGLPPPILVFSGYGNLMFNQLRVILKTHSWSYDDTVDGIVITGPGNTGTARLPAMFSVQMELAVVQTPQRMRETFSFAKFASGDLMNGQNVGFI